jgi:hypothetical protein
MSKFKTTIALLALLLIAAACGNSPTPAPESTAPPSAPSATPAVTEDETSGYPAGESGEAGYPVEEDPDAESGYPLPEVPETDESGYPASGEGSTEESGSGYPAPGEGECEPEAAEPQEHQLTAADGVALVGTFYPPAGCGAPVVVLFHQFGSEKTSWTQLALWLQNRTDETVFAGGLLAAPAGQYAWFPQLPEDLSFAVFAIDFRGHGESVLAEGNPEPAGFLLDAQAALEFAKTLPNVDPNRVITIGASIGADASVDACLDLEGSSISADQTPNGCIGALALSPGNFLGVPYVEAVTRLGSPPFDVSILCIAAEQDANAPDLCMADVPENHAGVVYVGRDEHGIGLLIEGMEPDIGQVIHDFLLETLGLEG